SHNIHTVISHLFYIPVILACWRFPKPGIIFTFGIICGYIGLEYFSHHSVLDSDVILRCLIIIFIGFVIALLSQNLHDREESYRRLLSAIDTGVIKIDRSGTIVYANPYAVNVLDRKAVSLKGNSLYEYAIDGSDLRGFLEQCLKNGHSDTTRELVLKRKDGFPVPVVLTGYSQKGEDIILTLTDLSEEKWLAHELATGRMVMTTLIDAIPEGIFLSDTRGTIIEVNKSCRDLTGWSDGTDLFKEASGLFSPDASEKIRHAIHQTIYEKQSVTLHLEAAPDENTRHYELSLTPVPDDTKSITRIAGVIHDITTRENYLKQIREREEYLRMVLDGLPLATLVIGPDHKVLSVNQALAMLFEREVNDLVGTDEHGHLLYPGEERPMLCDLMVGDEVDVLLDEWYSDLYSPSPTVPGAYEVIDFFPHIGEAGKWIMCTSARLVDDKGVTIGAIETFEDFSTQKAAEEAIRISEERFKIASHIATDLIFEYDQKSDQILWFGDIEKWLGLDSPARVSTLTGWTTLIHEEDIGKVKGAFIHHVLTGDPITEELRIKHRNGQYQTWIIKAVALYNANFQQIKTVGIVSDISEMRANEEAKKKALIAIEKYIEQFAILNDHIRNPLQIIAGYNDLQGGEYAHHIASQIAKVNQIVDQLDKGWIESESIRDFLRRHYGISVKDSQK
ncbi:PAS domain S-box protein, partial [Methanospirillum hungatei]|uniref:PAS domain-containing protein n=1 Tax=Methanospirillum hungatei TaxID=2203 RepID=UPI0026EEF87D